MFLGFSFQRNQNRYIFFEPSRVPTVFPSVCLARVAFSLINLPNVFQQIASCINTDASTWLLPLDLFHAYRPRNAWQTSHKANEFSRATLCTAYEDRDMKLPKPVFTCHNLACKPPQTTCMRATLGHFYTVRLQANSGQTESR